MLPSQMLGSVATVLLVDIARETGIGRSEEAPRRRWRWRFQAITLYSWAERIITPRVKRVRRSTRPLRRDEAALTRLRLSLEGIRISSPRAKLERGDLVPRPKM